LAFVKNLPGDFRAARAPRIFPRFSWAEKAPLGICPYRESGRNRREIFSISRTPLWRAGESTYAKFPTIDSRNIHYSLTIFSAERREKTNKVGVRTCQAH
jgi:hypothetical protein